MSAALSARIGTDIDDAVQCGLSPITPVDSAMVNLWNDAEAANFRGDLALRVYSSRLLGRDKTLVLHGGGNTSVKIGDTLWVKGSGSNLADVEKSTFSGVRLARALELLGHDGLTNAEMRDRLMPCLIRDRAPRPSIETLMHAALPYRYVEHTHAYSVLAVVNTEHGAAITRAVFGNRAPLVPYCHSGVDLARACVQALQERGTQDTIGLILQFHGVVAFGNTARESYENMIRLVSLAEDYLKQKRAWDILADDARDFQSDGQVVERFCDAASRIARRRLMLRQIDDPACFAFSRRNDLALLTQQGPSTPQHAVYTKRVPQLGWDVDAYAARYTEYLTHALGPAAANCIDCAARIIIDPGAGVYALGVDDTSTGIATDFYRRDVEVMVRASAHDAYRAAPAQAIALAEFEYGGFGAKARAEPNPTGVHSSILRQVDAP